MQLVKDHEGWEWYVAKDDPGWPAVRALEKTGFLAQLVLPRSVILSGELPADDYAAATDAALASVLIIPHAAPAAAAYLRKNVEFHVRLAACVQQLRTMLPADTPQSLPAAHATA